MMRAHVSSAIKLTFGTFARFHCFRAKSDESDDFGKHSAVKDRNPGGNGLGLVDSEIISIRQQSSFKL